MNALRAVALVLLVGQLAFTVAIVPRSLAWSFAEPTHLATISGVLVTLLLLACRFARNTERLERTTLALFLGGMPLVYAWGAVLRDPSALPVEVVGVVIFVGLAIAGWTRAPWLLGAGIIAHGLGWDAWHHGRSLVVPDWYALGCLVADLGVGAFALAYAAPATPSAQSRTSTLRS